MELGRPLFALRVSSIIGNLPGSRIVVRFSPVSFNDSDEYETIIYSYSYACTRARPHNGLHSPRVYMYIVGCMLRWFELLLQYIEL